MKKAMTVAILSILAAGAFAAADADAAKKQASEKAWLELKKANDALVAVDFKGGFANYWHDSIDAAREIRGRARATRSTSTRRRSPSSARSPTAALRRRATRTARSATSRRRRSCRG